MKFDFKPFDSVPTNLYATLSTEGDEWQRTVLNVKQRIMIHRASAETVVLN